MTDIDQSLEAAIRKIAPDCEEWRVRLNVGLLSFYIQVIHIVHMPTPRGLQPGTPRQAHKELQELAKATEAFISAVHGLSALALERLDECRERSGITWPISAPYAASLLLDEKYPDLADLARAAADTCGTSPKRGRRRDEVRLRLASKCAEAYRAATGRAPTRITKAYGESAGLEIGDFHTFAASVFEIAGLRPSDKIFRDVVESGAAPLD